MSATERTVRHLRLRAESEASVRRAALKLEDALRCASLPDAGARVLLVRRLDLGVFAAGASPQTLSLLLEQRVAASGATWVHGADPNAERADFVFFRDALEARYELALRLAGAGACAAWFWPLAVSEFKLVEDAQANLRSIALAIAALPEAPAAFPAWIARLTAAGAAPGLAQAIGPVEGAVLLRAARLSEDACRLRAIQIATPEPPQLASAARDVDPAQVPQRREFEPAFTALPMWLRTLGLAGGFVPQVVSMARVVHVAPAASAAAQNQAGIGPVRQEQRDPEVASPLVATDASAEEVHASPAPEQIKGDTAQVSAPPDRIRAETAVEPSSSGLPFLDAAPSAYGGLLFLLPVLQRLGYATWAEVLPEGAAAHVAQQVLESVLWRLNAPSDDPAWLFASSPSNDDFGSMAVKAPACWGDPTLAAPRGSAANDIVALAEQAQPAAALAHVWLIACRRWLRRVAGIGVASLVMRPGAIGLTATHVELFFRLSDADLRVRRAGLDFDPGWVPWYGRVVSFHYLLEAQA